MAAEFARWDDIDVQHRGRVVTSGGHGFAALSRVRLLRILQRRCADLGVSTRFLTTAPPTEQLTAEYDLVVAADGVNSAIRTKYADAFEPSVRTHRCRYMWLGTDLVFDAFRFQVQRTPHGVMQVHGYPYDAHGSTFIVEMHERVWRAAGFDRFATGDFAPGESDHQSIAVLADVFADLLGGHRLIADNSRWLSFATVTTARWSHGKIVLLGDAAHTAHFSIGSGTKLAMEDALALAACLRENPDIPTALAAYEAERRPVVASTQRAAAASLRWFEDLGRYTDQEPLQFAFNLLTRSRRVTYDNLKLRDPEFVAEVNGGTTPPMFRPFQLRGLTLKNRVIVSPMDMYSARDGVPDDFHLVHLGSKALGGAGLVMTEMVCVSPNGRITPGCTGLYTDEQEAAWRRVVEFVHKRSSAALGLQIGHSGRKGSTKLMWEGIDEPLPEGNWPVVGPSPLPYRPGVNQVPHELSRPELETVKLDFVAAAERGARAGFDLLELHCAHGYLLSSFLSPLTNRRRDE